MQTYDSATSHSLSETFPFQKVLHSSIKDSAPDYFLYHKLLHNCLLGLPLFGSLLLSHSATKKKKQTNKSLVFISDHSHQKQICFLFVKSSPCCWDIHRTRQCTLPCPSHNDPHASRSAPPAVAFVSTTYCSFQSTTQHVSIDTRLLFILTLKLRTYCAENSLKTCPHWCTMRYDEQYAHTLSVCT